MRREVSDRARKRLDNRRIRSTAQFPRAEPQTVILAQDIATELACKIPRRLRPDGPWTDAGMSIENEITLTNQERGKEWEYRVLAVNKAGEDEPGNTVTAVL